MGDNQYLLHLNSYSWKPSITHLVKYILLKIYIINISDVQVI